MKFIPYGHQNITQSDIDAVCEVLRADFITQGPVVEDFEQQMCKYINCRHAVCCSSGTAALHLAVKAAGIKDGDVGIVPALTFAATANCISFCRGVVKFADIDDTLTMSPDSCRLLLEESRKEGNPAKIVITVDMSGNKCNYDAFKQLQKEYGFIWISDSCHRVIAEGGLGGPNMTVYSFHPVKHITTGEGGMILTDSDEYAHSMIMNRSHGITKAEKYLTNKKLAYDSKGNLNPWYYEMQQLGFNYRMTDIQAALGRSQLKRIDESIKRRQEIGNYYREHLKDLSYVDFPELSPWGEHAYHLAVLLLDFKKLNKTRAEVMSQLKAKGIGTQVHYIPVPMLPYYKNQNCRAEMAKASAYYDRCLSFPCFPTVTDDELAYICEGIRGLASR